MNKTLLKLSLLVILIPSVILPFVVIHYYFHFSSLIDNKLADTSWSTPSEIYAAPTSLVPGKKVSMEGLIETLRRAGYKENSRDRISKALDSTFHINSSSSIEISDHTDQLNPAQGAQIRIKGGIVTEIKNADNSNPMDLYSLKPEVVSAVFSKSREKHKFVPFKEIPPILVNAVLASEDKRFFKHRGVDMFSIIRALFADLGSRGTVQGGSTLTQQFVKNFFLTPERTWRRKIAEAYLALLLEKRYSKEQIFEFYSNKVYLGQRGSFGIVGFAEGAEAYFGKNLSTITLSEAALLAALIRAPNKYSPHKYPEKAKQWRDTVLEAMRENDFITEKQKLDAKKQPLTVKPQTVFNYSEAPYFVDYVRDQLLQEVPEKELIKRRYKIYTTLNRELQKAAYEAVSNGLKSVDALFKKKKAKVNDELVQASLIALDPRTGEILAMVGGRNYAESQFNRVTEAKRQPGSSFKPFVYAAALDTAFNQNAAPITTLSTVNDEPTVFTFENKTYEPHNFKDEYHGVVTLRQAITQSLNIPTVKIAERVGFDQVVKLAKAAGLNEAIKPYPSMALGTFEVTSLEMARAYTAFANKGWLVEPFAVRRIVRDDNVIVKTGQVQKRQALSSETAYMVTNLLQSVINSGTGAGARARGFTIPAAGKTGTSHDGWFAGYTPELLCIVWVGFDDNRELKLSGSQSALPIWTEFMKKAQSIIPLKREDFTPPEGIAVLEIDPVTGLLASPLCPTRRIEYFIKGTEPKVYCGGIDHVINGDKVPFEPGRSGDVTRDEDEIDRQKKKGFWRKIFRF